MKNRFLSFFYFLLSLVPSVIAFFSAYSYTEAIFIKNKYPYPFERFCIAVGLGTAFWVFGLVHGIRWIFKKMTKPRNISAYAVEDKLKSEATQILK